MRWWDIADVLVLEEELFSDDTWSERVFWSELAQADSRHYVVAAEAASVAHHGVAGHRGGDGSPDGDGDGDGSRDRGGRGDSHESGVEETVVGYAGLAVYGEEAHVLTLGVRTDHQGRGLGGVLLRDLLDAAHNRGARRVLLEVRAGNLPAERLYVRHGFTRVGIRKRYYQPSGADAVVMVRGG